MKVTRYVNGKRVIKPFSDDIIIQNAEIPRIINQVNLRMLAQRKNKDGDGIDHE